MDLMELGRQFQERINTPSKDPHESLCRAILRHDFADVKDGLRHRALDLNKLHESGQTPLMLAIFEGQKEMVCEILKYKPDLTIEDELGMSALNMVHLPAMIGYEHPKTSFEDKDDIKDIVMEHFNQAVQEAKAAEMATKAQQENKESLKRRGQHSGIYLKRRMPKR